jgi:hypothetical protein
MWKAWDTVMRKLNTFWYEVEGFKQNMKGLLLERLRGQDKFQTTTTDESYESSEEDSGFADDEGIYSTSYDYIFNSKHKDSESLGESDDDCDVNDNDFVLDSDIKNQQRITLMSLLYSRALDRKLNAVRSRKSSYTLNKKEHARKHK